MPRREPLDLASAKEVIYAAEKLPLVGPRVFPPLPRRGLRGLAGDEGASRVEASLVRRPSVGLPPPRPPLAPPRLPLPLELAPVLEP